MIAVYKGHTAIAEQLLTAGARVNMRDRDGDTALSVAIRQNYAAIVRLLLDSGVDDEIRQEAWLQALTANCPEILELFITRGMPLDSPTLSGETPLILAVERGNLGSVQTLLQAGANPNISTEEGETALEGKSRQRTNFTASGSQSEH